MKRLFRLIRYRLRRVFGPKPAPYVEPKKLECLMIGGPLHGETKMLPENIHTVVCFATKNHEPNWMSREGVMPQIDYDFVEVKYHRNPEDPTIFTYCDPNEKQ